jgi:hypothetical protein
MVRRDGETVRLVLDLGANHSKFDHTVRIDDKRAIWCGLAAAVTDLIYSGYPVIHPVYGAKTTHTKTTTKQQPQLTLLPFNPFTL